LLAELRPDPLMHSPRLPSRSGGAYFSAEGGHGRGLYFHRETEERREETERDGKEIPAQSKDE